MAKTPQQILEEITSKFRGKLHAHQEAAIAYVLRSNQLHEERATRFEDEMQSRDRQARTKNGFVGRMTPVYGKRVMRNTLNLDPSQWRRL